MLRVESPRTRVIVAEPENAPMLASGIGRIYRADGTAEGSHPLFRPHPMQGLAPDFIPQLTSDALDGDLVDAIIPVSGADSLRLARDLARQEGIFCGITGGATLAAAQRVAETAPRGSSILFMVPDTGERYLSTPQFESIGQEMDDEERALSNSTPLCRFGVPSPQPASPSVTAVESVPVRGTEYVTKAISDPTQPVVMFALEWCEFCWAVRRLLKDFGVPFRSVDLDAVVMQTGGLSTDIRSNLRQRTGAATIPQIFIGGAHVGGAMDVLALHDRGELTPMLSSVGIVPNAKTTVVAKSYLPKWLAVRLVG